MHASTARGAHYFELKMGTAANAPMLINVHVSGTLSRASAPARGTTVTGKGSAGYWFASLEPRHGDKHVLGHNHAASTQEVGAADNVAPT